MSNLSINVRDVMTTDVATIKPDYPVKYAESLMKYKDVGCLVVVEGGLPIGMITENDIVKRVHMQKHDPHFLTVRDAMSQPLLWVEPETPLHEAAQLMMDKKLRRLPVVGNLSTGPRLVGLLTRVQMDGVETEK